MRTPPVSAASTHSLGVTTPSPFQIAIGDDVLEDLRQRLERAIIPDMVNGHSSGSSHINGLSGRDFNCLMMLEARADVRLDTRHWRA